MILGGNYCPSDLYDSIKSIGMKKILFFITFFSLFGAFSSQVHAQVAYESVTEKIHYTFPDRKTQNQKGEWIPQSTLISTESSNPKIKIYFYGDLTRPYTQQFFRQTFEPLRRKYQSDVQFIFQNHAFFDRDGKSIRAGMIGQCAAEQQQFWPNAVNIGVYQDNLKDYSYLSNLDVDLLKKCLNDPRTEGTVRIQDGDAQLFGFNGDPTFIIQNPAKPQDYAVKLFGAQDISLFDQAIKEELGYNPDKERIIELQLQIASLSASLSASEQKVSFLESQVFSLQKIINSVLHFFHFK